MTDSLNLTLADYQAMLEALQSIADGNYRERLELNLETDAGKALQANFNGALQAIDDHLGEDRDATMGLALGMSECFGVLAAVRMGDLTARVSDEMLTSDNELMVQFGRSLNETIADIEKQIDTIRHQQETQAAMEHLVRQLQTPILELWDDVLCLPVIGMVDSRRSADMMETLLNEIVVRRSKYVILDITGVEIVDTRTADHFVKVMKSAELLGTRCIMTGIRPAVAQTLVELGVDLSSIRTLRNLQEGLRYCLREAEVNRAARLTSQG